MSAGGGGQKLFARANPPLSSDPSSNLWLKWSLQRAAPRTQRGELPPLERPLTEARPSSRCSHLMPALAQTTPRGLREGRVGRRG